MKQEQLNRILRLVNKTGDKFIVADQETDGVFVVMDMLDYEEMQGVYEEDDLDFNPDDYLNDLDNEDETAEDFLCGDVPEIPKEFLVEDKEDEKGEEISEISQKDDFSPSFLDPEEKTVKNDDFTEDLAKKEDYYAPEIVEEELPKIPVKNTRPTYSSVGQLLKNKDFLKDEIVIEEINPMEELHGLTVENGTEFEQVDEDLDEEDRDRFYLETV